jgi:Lrp/AsnC family leucine-responsive transcriptional regulator
MEAMRANENSEIDGIDREIIRQLLAHARISFRDLGVKVHLSPNATAERVRRLVESGIIGGFHAEIDRTKLGQTLQAYIDIKLNPVTSAQTFQTTALRLPGVLSMTSMTGALDFRLRVACKDQSDLVNLIETLRSKAGVQETNTSIILGEVIRWA